MAFIENLRKNLNSAADYTVKKTGEVTGAAKVAVDIRTQNAHLAKCFENIGRAYFKGEKGLSETSGTEIAALMEEADEILAEIDALRLKQAKLKNCVLCPACRAQISDKSIYCPMCGVKLPVEEPVEEPAEESAAEEPAAEEIPAEEVSEADAPAEEAPAEDEKSDEE